MVGRRKVCPLSASLYVAEFDGGFLKIGWSSRPSGRFKEILRIATHYMGHPHKILRTHISIRCVNYRELEDAIHWHFNPEAMGGELFDLAFDDAVSAMNALPFIESHEANLKEDARQEADSAKKRLREARRKRMAARRHKLPVTATRTVKA